MKVTERQDGDFAILDMEGRFDFGARRDFKEAVDRVQNAGSRYIVLNMQDIAFVDSSALGLLVVAHQNLKLKEGRIGLVNPQPYVRQILDLANVPRMIPVFNTVDEAKVGMTDQAALTS